MSTPQALLRVGLVQTRTPATHAAALEHVGPVDPGKRDLDQPLPGAGLGHRPLLGYEHLGPARLADHDGLHYRGEPHVPLCPCCHGPQP